MLIATRRILDDNLWRIGEFAQLRLDRQKLCLDSLFHSRTLSNDPRESQCAVLLTKISELLQVSLFNAGPRASG